MFISDDQRGALFNLADEFESLLDSEPDKETIHTFMNENTLLFGTPQRHASSGWSLEGLESKFPLTPDRIPDFMIYYLRRDSMKEQYISSWLHFIELKRPSARLYVAHNRMSKDLNDAWMESKESLRLFTSNCRDVLRRLLKTTTEQYATIANTNGIEMPRARCTILVGRRSSLDAESLARTRHLSEANIKVFSYDYVLDQLRIAAENGFIHL